MNYQEPQNPNEQPANSSASFAQQELAAALHAVRIRVAQATAWRLDGQARNVMQEAERLVHDAAAVLRCATVWQHLVDTGAVTQPLPRQALQCTDCAVPFFQGDVTARCDVCGTALCLQCALQHSQRHEVQP